MIIDLILDRRYDIEDSGVDSYDPHTFYTSCIQYGDISDRIARSMDSGGEYEVKNALIRYVVEGNYSLDIVDFILSVWWVDNDAHNIMLNYILEGRKLAERWLE